MKYLVVTSRGDYLPIALRLQREGHNVSFYVEEKDRRNIGKNLVNCISNIPRDIDIALIDHKSTYEFSEKINAKCIPSSEFVDYFCNEPDYFIEVCQLAEIAYDITLLPDNAVEAWFNGDKFVPPVFMHKYKTKLFPNDIGPDTDGYTMIETSATSSNFPASYKSTLGKLEKILRKNGYKGLMRAEMHGDTVVRFNHRMTVPTTFECMAGRLSDILKALVNNELKSVPVHKEVAYGIRVSIPPFPYCPRYFWTAGHYHMNGMPLTSYDSERMKHFWGLHIAKDGNGTIVSSGHSGDLGYVTARAGIMKYEAGRRILRTISRLNIPNLQYRMDFPYYKHA